MNQYRMSCSVTLAICWKVSFLAQHLDARKIRFLIIAQPYVSVLDSGYFLEGGGGVLWKHFFVLFFLLLTILLSHTKIKALVVDETGAITLHMKGLCYQPPRKTPSLCLKDRVTEGISHASCFMAMLSIVILCKRTWRETKKEKIESNLEFKKKKKVYQ